MHTYDCVIVGGGSAGLAAAMVLVRARRSVLVIDRARQSNRVTRASHGVFCHDGALPEDLYATAREQLSAYPTYHFENNHVSTITCDNGYATLTTDTHDSFRSRSVLLAQGVDYELPTIPGLKELWGTKAWHCAYCDGYEYRDKKLLIIADTDSIEHTSVLLPTWSTQLYYACDKSQLKPDIATHITVAGGDFRQAVTRLSSSGTQVQAHFNDGTNELFDAIVVGPHITPADSLADALGCKRGDNGVVLRDDMGRTSTTGIYVAGDQTDIMQQVNVAVASGHKAAVAINEDLCHAKRNRLLQAQHR